MSGKSYGHLLQDEIFSKLGMKASGEYAHTQVVPRRATGYEFNSGKYASADFRDQSNAMGTGNIYSSVEDLFRWSNAIDRNALLNKELTQKMLTPGMGSYGYGWFIFWLKFADGDSVQVQGHAGQTDGFNAMLLRVPSTNSFMVYLANTNPIPIGKINQWLIGILRGKKAEVRIPLSRVIGPGLAGETMAAAIKKLDALKTDTRTYDYNWEDIDDVVRQLVTDGKLNEALMLAQHSAVDFPGHQRIHNSLGWVYFKMGEYGKAKKEYEETLKKFPLNGEALAMLANAALK